MQISRLTATFASAATAMLLASGAYAGDGHTAQQLVKAGYTCFNAGPSNFTHCWLERQIGNPVIPTKVFSPDGSEFLGTEQLLREDIYAGQPCPQDGIDFWEYLGPDFPYFACHHFETGHH